MTVAVGLWLALAVLVLGVRVPRRVVAPSSAPSAGRRRARPVDELELSAVLSAAAAQLRAGAPPADAWARALGRSVGRVPSVAELPGPASRRRREGHAQRAAAVVAAARLSDELGAPLAAVLDRVGVGLAADEECEGERIAALAGPRATARILAWLPLLGLVLGVALGADPVSVVLGGGVGTAAAVLGVVLVVVGRWWTAALLARAERDDDGASDRPRGAVGASPARAAVGIRHRPEADGAVRRAA